MSRYSKRLARNFKTAKKENLNELDLIVTPQLTQSVPHPPETHAGPPQGSPQRAAKNNQQAASSYHEATRTADGPQAVGSE